MVDLYVSVITLKVREVNTPNKRGLLGWIKNI